MSILGKSWELSHNRQANESLWAALLSSRRITDPGSFFADASISDLHDPFLFDDMQKSVDRLQNAINARERIVIYGDYDVDGTSGSSILIHTLRFLGGEVSYRIPHRMKDGYGLHMKYVEELHKQNVSIIITVDCGISCAKEVAAAQELKMDVIITDHHTIPADVPPAFATIHPQLAEKYPFKKLSGSGVAFKLACALLIQSKNEDFIPKLTDLASLGTVADCVPLVGENRAIVKLGLKQMRHTEWDGLQAILESANAWDKEEFTSETIGFQIGPRINASGRIDNPLWAMQALLAKGTEAREKSQKLEELNKSRQEMTRSMMEEAEVSLDLSQPLIIAEGIGWSSGIVGLIAGRLQEKYGKPSFILEDRGEFLVGSARSFPGFHAVTALSQAHDLIENYGGHEQAAGFRLKKENYPEFKKALQAYAKDFFQSTPIKSTVKVDFALQAEDFTIEKIDKISTFAPFGIGNPSPLFLMEDIEIINTRPVGKTGDHLKFTAKFHGQLHDGIAFRWGEHEDALWKAKEILVHLEKNKWNGKESVQLRLVDAK